MTKFRWLHDKSPEGDRTRKKLPQYSKGRSKVKASIVWRRTASQHYAKQAVFPQTLNETGAHSSLLRTRAKAIRQDRSERDAVGNCPHLLTPWSYLESVDTRKLLGHINIFSKVTGLKINLEK